MLKRVILDGARRDKCNKVAVVKLALLTYDFLPLFPIGNKITKIHGHDVFQYSIADENVFVPVVFEIKNERSPTPVSSRHARQESNFLELARPVVQLQTILNHLVM